MSDLTAPVNLEHTPTLTRRNFLKGMAILGATAATAAVAPYVLEPPESRRVTTPEQVSPSKKTTEPSTYTEAPMLDSNTNLEPDEGSYVDTSLRTMALYVGNAVLSIFARKLNFNNIGNASFNKIAPEESEAAAASDEAKLRAMPRSKMYASLGFLVFGGPALEELLFRKIPSTTVDKRSGKGNAWATGFATSGAFALAHAYSPRTKRATVPIPQFNTGLLTWWLQRNRGYRHAVVSHALNNLPSAAIGGICYEYVKRTPDTQFKKLTSKPRPYAPDESKF